MDSFMEQIDIIGMMAAHETAIARLYETYAAKIPQLREFFGELAEKEVEHARTITDFVARVKAGSVRVNPRRFSTQSILASLDYLEEHQKKAEAGAINGIIALSTCVDLEDALIEKKFFEIFESDAPEVKQFLQKLSVETTEHRQQARLALEQERKRAG